MPKATLNRRAMPADMQAAIAAYTGNVNRAKRGERTLAPAIARAAESGATRDDIRAATRGLITLATKARR